MNGEICMDDYINKNSSELCPICCAPLSNDGRECSVCGATIYRNSNGEIVATDFDDWLDK